MFLVYLVPRTASLILSSSRLTSVLLDNKQARLYRTATEHPLCAFDDVSVRAVLLYM